MRLVAGKCLMVRNAPPGLTDTVDRAERDSTALIERWHGHGRLAYAHTVRFEPTGGVHGGEHVGLGCAAFVDVELERFAGADQVVPIAVQAHAVRRRTGLMISSL